MIHKLIKSELYSINIWKIVKFVSADCSSYLVSLCVWWWFESV